MNPLKSKANESESSIGKSTSLSSAISPRARDPRTRVVFDSRFVATGPAGLLCRHVARGAKRPVWD
jgi:hypothetical protein